MVFIPHSFEEATNGLGTMIRRQHIGNHTGPNSVWNLGGGRRKEEVKQQRKKNWEKIDRFLILYFCNFYSLSSQIRKWNPSFPYDRKRERKGEKKLVLRMKVREKCEKNYTVLHALFFSFLFSFSLNTTTEDFFFLIFPSLPKYQTNLIPIITKAMKF